MTSDLERGALEALDDLADRARHGGNHPQHRGGRARGVSLAFQRVNVVRPKQTPAGEKNAPAESATRLTGHPVSAPFGRRLCRSADDLRAALRARRDELNVSHASLEEIMQAPHGYVSKITAATPRRNLTARMLQDLLSALALGVAAVVLIEDPEQAAKMRLRWKRRQRLPTRGAVALPKSECVADPQTSFQFVSDTEQSKDE